MKNTFRNMSILLVILLMVISFAACKDDGSIIPSIRFVATINADSYVDYAETVKFDYEVHPELVDIGLFWMMYDENAEKVVGVNVNDTEAVDNLGVALVDPTKPTIINIHGVQLETYMWTDAFSNIYNANTTVLPPSEYGYEGVVNMNKIWLDRGWNVMNFMYHRFSDETIAVNGIASNKVIEAKNWSTEGPQKMRYRLRDGSFSASYDKNGNLKGEAKYPELEYCVSEYFVGDYLRALNSAPGLADNEIRITCHSMGGTVTMASAFLLTELVKADQIPAAYLPDRLAILDGYIGVAASGNPQTDNILSNTELEISWTGIKCSAIGTTEVYLNCLEQIVEDFDMPVEYYVDINGFVPQIGGSLFELIKQYCAVAYYDLEFPGMLNDHNAVRELYNSSFAAALPPLDITNEGVTAYAISARSSIVDIKARRGHEYLLTQGKNSGNAENHGFIRIK
ncbi:MAG: hypothetical protein EOM87_01400 [Clostridia bacterium]|nr:hypothetical protein [Clostridia bacterium]